MRNNSKHIKNIFIFSKLRTISENDFFRFFCSIHQQPNILSPLPPGYTFDFLVKTCCSSYVWPYLCFWEGKGATRTEITHWNMSSAYRCFIVPMVMFTSCTKHLCLISINYWRRAWPSKGEVARTLPGLKLKITLNIIIAVEFALVSKILLQRWPLFARIRNLHWQLRVSGSKVGLIWNEVLIGLTEGNQQRE